MDTKKTYEYLKKYKPLTSVAEALDKFGYGLGKPRSIHHRKSRDKRGLVTQMITRPVHIEPITYNPPSDEQRTAALIDDVGPDGYEEYDDVEYGDIELSPINRSVLLPNSTEPFYSVVRPLMKKEQEELAKKDNVEKDFNELMEFMGNNTDKMQEGVYIQFCDKMKKLYETRKKNN